MAPTTFEWLDYENEHQIAWALRYLQRKGVVPAMNPSAGTLKSTLSDLAHRNPAWLIEIDFKMKAAWAQEKHRASRKDKKAYHFFMSRNVEPALHKLSSRTGKPIAKAVEDLLLEDRDLHAHYKAMADGAIKEYQENYEKRGLARLRKTAIQRAAHDITYLKKTINAQEKVITELAHQVAWLRTQYERTLPPGDISNQAHQAKALIDEANLRVKALVDYPALGDDDLPADIAELEDTVGTEAGEAQPPEEDGQSESTSQAPAHHDNREQKTLGPPPAPTPTQDRSSRGKRKKRGKNKRRDKMPFGGRSNSTLPEARYIPKSELSTDRSGDLDHE